jgi:hypothetical protein
MKSVFVSLTLLALGALVVGGSGCKNTCSSTDKGSECTSKSVTNFVGTPVPQELDYQAGQSISVETIYGNVTVQTGAPAGKIEVTFQPFDYEGYDEKDLATRNMNEGLDLHSDKGSTIAIVAARNGNVNTNGLGAGITVTIPPEFDGMITVHNAGSGPLAGTYKEFDVNVAGTAQANAVSVTNDADLGDTYVQGTASVTSTSVTAHEAVQVLGVADNVSITTDGTGLGDPGVILGIVSISATATGGSITSQEGGIQASFPSTGDYSVQADAPNGAVNEGTFPTGCNLGTGSAQGKTVTCGAGGPNYKLLTNGVNDDVFQEGNIDLSYQ